MEKHEPCQIVHVETCMNANLAQPTYLTAEKIPQTIRKPKSYSEDTITALRSMREQEMEEALQLDAISVETHELQRLLSLCIVAGVSKPAISLALQIYLRTSDLERQMDSVLFYLAVMDIADRFASAAYEYVRIGKKISRLLLNKAETQKQLTDREKAFIDSQRRAMVMQRDSLQIAVVKEFEEFKQATWTAEEEILIYINYRLAYVSPSDFLTLFADVSQLSEKSFIMARNLCYAIESQVASQQYPPSEIAAACTSLLFYEDNKIRWSNSLQFWSGYQLNDITNALEFVDKFWAREKIQMLAQQ